MFIKRAIASVLVFYSAVAFADPNQQTPRQDPVEVLSARIICGDSHAGIGLLVYGGRMGGSKSNCALYLHSVGNQRLNLPVEISQEMYGFDTALQFVTGAGDVRFSLPKTKVFSVSDLLGEYRGVAAGACAVIGLEACILRNAFGIRVLNVAPVVGASVTLAYSRIMILPKNPTDQAWKTRIVRLR